MNDFSDKEAAAYRNLHTMSWDSKRYNINIDETDENYQGRDDYATRTIFPNTIARRPQAGYDDQLYNLDHFFIEQRIGQDNARIGKYTPYEEAHSATNYEQATNYGYRLGGEKWEGAAQKGFGSEPLSYKVELLDKTDKPIGNTTPITRDNNGHYSGGTEIESKPSGGSESGVNVHHGAYGPPKK